MTEKRDSEGGFDNLKNENIAEEEQIKIEKEISIPKKDDNPVCSGCGKKMNSLIYTNEKRTYHKCRFCGHSYINKHN